MHCCALRRLFTKVDSQRQPALLLQLAMACCTAVTLPWHCAGQHAGALLTESALAWAATSWAGMAIISFA